MSIVDDTSMKLSEAPAGVTQWKKGRTVSVMNQVQSLIVAHVDSEGGVSGAKPRHSVFNVFTPMVCLAKANTTALAAEMSAWLFAFKGKVAKRFEHYNLPSDVLDDVPIQAVAFCFDSLVTNLSVLKRFRSSLFEWHAQRDGDRPLCPLLAVCCGVHQLALTRKHLVVAFPGFWASIVRLAHLFESGSFRSQFRTALLEVICSSFQHIPVAQLPPNVKDWRQARISVSQTAKFSKRTRLHLTLANFDNGDPDAETFTHWCTGVCCRGTSQEQRSHYALLQICKLYALLFTHGFVVPLLYRWVHASEALHFCKEPWVQFSTDTDSESLIIFGILIRSRSRTEKPWPWPYLLH